MSEENSEEQSGGLVKILLFAGGGVLLLLIGLGIGFFVFGGQPADPSEEIERIIERSDPEAAARAKAEAEAAAAADPEVGEDGELLGPPQKIVKISPDAEIFQTTYYEFTGTLLHSRLLHGGLETHREGECVTGRAGGETEERPPLQPSLARTPSPRH